MRYILDNIARLEELNLHDYELRAMEIDYFEKSLKLYVKNSQGQENIAKISKFYWLLVEAKEPWGEGNYIHELKVIKEQTNKNSEMLQEGVFGIEILINSGDKVTIYVSEFQFDAY